MIKQFFALFRGKANEAAQSITDRHGLTILRQQINDCAKAVNIARKAVAVAVAQNKQEEEQYEQIVSRIQDLENRTIIALEKGEGDIARDAAEAIAYLEQERDTSRAAQDKFQTGITRLKAQVRSAEARLRELKRGYQLASATNKTQKMRDTGDLSTVSTLNDAEETLARLKVRQTEIENISDAMAEMDEGANADRIIEKLADAGCGDPVKTSADDILKRLKKKLPNSQNQIKNSEGEIQ